MRNSEERAVYSILDDNFDEHIKNTIKMTQDDKIKYINFQKFVKYFFNDKNSYYEFMTFMILNTRDILDDVLVKNRINLNKLTRRRVIESVLSRTNKVIFHKDRVYDLTIDENQSQQILNTFKKLLKTYIIMKSINSTSENVKNVVEKIKKFDSVYKQTLENIITNQNIVINTTKTAKNAINEVIENANKHIENAKNDKNILKEDEKHIEDIVKNVKNTLYTFQNEMQNLNKQIENQILTIKKSEFINVVNKVSELESEIKRLKEENEKLKEEIKELKQQQKRLENNKNILDKVKETINNAILKVKNKIKNIFGRGNNENKKDRQNDFGR